MFSTGVDVWVYVDFYGPLWDDHAHRIWMGYPLVIRKKIPVFEPMKTAYINRRE